MTALTELKQQADHLGLAPEMVRLYGDLRLKTTWEKAITANKTITVDAVEVSAETIIDEVEIIPFTHDQDLHLPPNRREIMLEEVERQRGIFENAVLPPAPPAPPPIVIIVPERRDIPPHISPDRTEIAESDSPSPGIGRGDERLYPDDFNPNIDSIAEKATAMRAMFKAKYPDEFKAMYPGENIGDRLFEKIKSDILRYFEGIKEDLEYCLDVNYLENEDHYKEIKSLVELLEWNINNKYSIYDIWGTVPYFQREGFQKLIPFAIHDLLKDPSLCVKCWECTRETYWLVVETPAAIPILSDDFGGVFIPNKIHELGNYIYVWKFPGMIQAENFFHHVTDARKYCMIPAKSDLKINLNQPVLVGV